MQFGISTHLYHDQRLTRDHLAEIARSGFDAIELFATRTHFDYHDAGAAGELAAWLAETGLTLHSVHAPIVESLIDGVWGAALSNAVADEPQRTHVIAEAERALSVAAQVPFEFLVVHLGIPDAQQPAANDNVADAARRSVERLHTLANEAGVRLALEVIPNRISTVSALQRLIDDELELRDAGICLDIGHAAIIDDVVDTIEAASGHMWTTHVHDNDRRNDQHLVPFEGRIDWPGALVALQKVGYEGRLVFEVANTSTPAAVLARTRDARRRFEQILAS